MRPSLPVVNAPDELDRVEIPIPCEVPWDGMPGDERVRHCGQCKQNVYNVAMLTRVEATRLLRARACLRIYRRPDNTVMTSDCRERLRAARKRGLWVFAGTLLIVLWAQICAQFVGLVGLRRLVGGGHTMGEARPVPGQVAPLMGTPPVLPPPPIAGKPEIPVMGEPPPRLPHKPHKTPPRLMGRIAPPPPENIKVGKIKIDRDLLGD